MQRILTLGSLVFIGIFGLLTSCSFSPVNIEPNNIYMLNSTPTLRPHKSPNRKIYLLVTAPISNSIFNTTSMAYSVKPHQIGYFAKNRWAETPTQMLHQLIIQTLQKSGHFNQVGSASTMNHFNYILNTQLIILEQDYTTHPYTLKLKIRAQLINIATNDMIASREFSIEQNLNGKGPYAGVVAANLATEIVLRQLTTFCINHL